MFHILHKLYVVACLALLVATTAWVYARSGVSDGLADWYAVWQNKPKPASQAAAELSGDVVKVNDGTSLTLRATDQRFYSVALLGAVPLTNSNPGHRGSPDPATGRLRELVLSNQVEAT